MKSRKTGGRLLALAAVLTLTLGMLSGLTFATAAAESDSWVIRDLSISFSRQCTVGANGGSLGSTVEKDFDTFNTSTYGGKSKVGLSIDYYISGDQELVDLLNSKDGNKPNDSQIELRSSGTAESHENFVAATAKLTDWKNGEWSTVVIPLEAFTGKNANAADFDSLNHLRIYYTSISADYAGKTATIKFQKIRFVNLEQSRPADDLLGDMKKESTAAEVKALLALNPVKVTDKYTAAKAALQAKVDAGEITTAGAEVWYLKAALDNLDEYYYLSFANGIGLTQAAGLIASPGVSSNFEKESTNTCAYATEDGRSGVQATINDTNKSLYVYILSDLFKPGSDSKGTAANNAWFKQNNGKTLRFTVTYWSENEKGFTWQFGNSNNVAVKKSSSAAGWETATVEQTIKYVEDGVNSPRGVNGGYRVQTTNNMIIESISVEVIDKQAVVDNAATLSVVLGSSLAANIRLDTATLKQAFAADTTVKVTTTLNGTNTVKLSTTVAELTDTPIVQSLRPDQMGETVTVKIEVGTLITTKEFTVAGYMHKLIDGEYTTETKNLAAAALEYGIAAKAYTAQFGEDTADITDTTHPLTAADKPVNESSFSGAAGTATWYSASLVLTDGVSIRLKFDGETGKTYTVSDGTKDYKAEKDDDGHNYVDIPVNPDKYNENMTFVVKDGETVVSNTLTYSVAAYAKAKWNSDAQGGTLADLVQALMTYGEYAEKYTA